MNSNKATSTSINTSSHQLPIIVRTDQCIYMQGELLLEESATSSSDKGGYALAEVKIGCPSSGSQILGTTYNVKDIDR